MSLKKLFQACFLGIISQGFVQAMDDEADHQEMSDREKACGGNVYTVFFLIIVPLKITVQGTYY